LPKRPALELFCASLVVLFQELALIRWLPGQVRVLAYFPNLILISAFLGLGIGCLLARRRSLLWLWPASLLLVTASAWGLSNVVFSQQDASEFLWLLYYDLPRDAPVVASVELPIVVGFVLSALTFVPLGQIIARRLDWFREHSSVLWGYCWDIGGSLTGTILFAGVAFLGLFPHWWFLACGAVGLVFFRRRQDLPLYGVLVVAVLGCVLSAERAEWYSPYYALSVREAGDGVEVSANGALHQIALPLGAEEGEFSELATRARLCFRRPIEQLGRPVRRVLVLGAGTGNDVAVLLAEGAERVDAVEIDPVILDLGRRLHPSRPYDSERVRVHNTDARSFLNESDEEYDLIVFGTLDSMTRLSARSNVRLDNFVYTVDAIDRARERLSDDGGLAMLFMVGEDYIHEHIMGILATSFGEVPRVLGGDCKLFNQAYLAGPGFAHLPGPGAEEERRFLEETLPGIDVPSDDWPYLYLEQRGVSAFYLKLMALFLAIAVASVFLVSRQLRASARRWRTVDVEMFLFGAAFLLMETHFVTSINLTWGATWLTSAVVFGAILATVLLATVRVQTRAPSWWLAVAGLLASLVAVYLVPVERLVGSDPWLRLVLSVLYVGAPVFFASVCFALRFAARESPDVALGWNLLGAVAGGLLEFLAMALGFKALTLIALAFYAGVVLLRGRGGEPGG